MSTSALIPMSEIERMANAISKSSLFGIRTPEQAIALMLIAQAEGMHPAIAARDYHVIQGRPALKADAMLARFLQAGGKVEWKSYTDQAVCGTFSHPQGGSITVEWTIAQAKQAGLTGKDVWKQYPRAMLRSRVISEGIRTVFPGVVVGVYTPEEINDFDAKAPKEVPSEVVKDEPVSAARPAPNSPAENQDVVAESIPSISHRLVDSAITPIPKPTESAHAKEYYKAQVLGAGWQTADLTKYIQEVLKKKNSSECSLTDWMKLSYVTSNFKSFEEAIKAELK